jgi:hypothetical protein
VRVSALVLYFCVRFHRCAALLLLYVCARFHLRLALSFFDGCV